MLAVIGGPDVYGLFLDIGYDVFHLSRVPDIRLPGGRPVFPEIGPNRSPKNQNAKTSANGDSIRKNKLDTVGESVFCAFTCK